VVFTLTEQVVTVWSPEYQWIWVSDYEWAGRRSIMAAGIMIPTMVVMDTDYEWRRRGSMARWWRLFDGHR
jgi:hypothetical protein